jgi:hypothetical protein
LPYSHASPWQRSGALRSARQVLDAAYPFLSRSQWLQALEYLQPCLCLVADEVIVPHASLATLVYQLETYDCSATPGAGVSPAPAQAAAEYAVKQTYAIRPTLLTQLDRVNYSCRLPRSRVVNEALHHWLSRYPEAQCPLPEALCVVLLIHPPGCPVRSMLILFA